MTIAQKVALRSARDHGEVSAIAAKGGQVGLAHDHAYAAAQYAHRYLRLTQARENRKAREQAYRSCGLVKVKGTLGGTYWE